MFRFVHRSVKSYVCMYVVYTYTVLGVCVHMSMCTHIHEIGLQSRVFVCTIERHVHASLAVVWIYII